MQEKGECFTVCKRVYGFVCKAGRVNQIFVLAKLKVGGCWFNGLMTLMVLCVPFRYCCG